MPGRRYVEPPFSPESNLARPDARVAASWIHSKRSTRLPTRVICRHSASLSGCLRAGLGVEFGIEIGLQRLGAALRSVTGVVDAPQSIFRETPRGLASRKRIADVRYGSQADILGDLRDVRFTPESGHGSARSRGLLRATNGQSVDHDG